MPLVCSSAGAAAVPVEVLLLLLVLLVDSDRRSWAAGSDPDFAPRACSLRSIAMVASVSLCASVAPRTATRDLVNKEV